MNSLIAISRQPWALMPDALETMVRIAQRAHEPDFEALSAKLGRPLENTYSVEVRDGVAVIPVQGPLFPKANLFSSISGATSIEMMARDFSAALADPSISTIVLDIDSPGGQISGVSEFASLIRSARGVKPIVAYVSNVGASGAYWIATAADRIVVSDTAMLGSIGVVAVLNAESDPSKIQIVSSRAPDKRVDISTDAGKSKVQENVDALEAVFIQTVADYRSTTVDVVVERFGRGGVLVGRSAVDAGMADEVSTFEKLMSGIARRGSSMSLELMQSKLDAMQEQNAVLSAQCEQLKFKVGALEEKIEADKLVVEAAKNVATDLEAQLNQIKRDTRAERVRALFADLNREIADDKIDAYLSMSDETFAAVSADLRDLKPKVPAHLLGEKAVSRAPAKADAVDFGAKLFAQVAGAK